MAISRYVNAFSVLFTWTRMVALAVEFNDTIHCNGSSIDNDQFLRFGTCIPYVQWTRSLPCDELYTPNVDYFFLPNERAPGYLTRLLDFAADMTVTLNAIIEPCRDAAVRGLCYYYFPPCGNATHFEPPNSLCATTCHYITENLCQREWAAAVEHFKSISFFLELFRIDILNCSRPGGPLEPLPQCCSDAGIEEPTVAMLTQSEGQPRLGPSPDQTKTVIAATVSSVLLMIIAVVVVAVIVYVAAARRLRGSKLVLQVTGDSMDIVDEAKLPSIIVHRDSEAGFGGHHGSTRYIPEDVLDSSRPRSLAHLEDDNSIRRPRLPSFFIRQMSESKLLIKSEQLKLLDSVGQGEFGVVYRGHLTGWANNNSTELVAVKTLKAASTSSKKDISDLIEESLKMKSFHHPNVLHLIGVCIDAGTAPYLILPYMLNGSLLSYLRKERPNLTIVEGATEDLVIEAKKRLLAMCLQIAKGMEYLAEQKFVHRDLAARNCMIDEKFVIKVADFGLSEDIYCKDYFRQALSGNAQEEGGVIKLPVKWMALESLSDGIFTEKTDVWSFGVTFWEVFSLGRSPYPGVDPFTLVKYLEEGRRLDRPNNAACTNNVYDVMFNCWNEQPEKRPSFAELVLTLTCLLEDIAAYLDFSVLANNEQAVDYDHLYTRAPAESQKGYDHLEPTQ